MSSNPVKLLSHIIHKNNVHKKLKKSYVGPVPVDLEVLNYFTWRRILSFYSPQNCLIITVNIVKNEQISNQIGINIGDCPFADLANTSDIKHRHFILSIQPCSPIHIVHKFLPGDEILEANGIRIHGVSRTKASNIIKLLPKKFQIVAARWNFSEDFNKENDEFKKTLESLKSTIKSELNCRSLALNSSNADFSPNSSFIDYDSLSSSTLDKPFSRKNSDFSDRFSDMSAYLRTVKRTQSCRNSRRNSIRSSKIGEAAMNDLMLRNLAESTENNFSLSSLSKMEELLNVNQKSSNYEWGGEVCVNFWSPPDRSSNFKTAIKDIIWSNSIVWIQLDQPLRTESLGFKIWLPSNQFSTLRTKSTNSLTGKIINSDNPNSLQLHNSCSDELSSITSSSMLKVPKNHSKSSKDNPDCGENTGGVIVMEIEPNSVSFRDARICAGDRVLYVNHRSLKHVKSVNEASSLFSKARFDSDRILLGVLKPLTSISALLDSQIQEDSLMLHNLCTVNNNLSGDVPRKSPLLGDDAMTRELIKIVSESPVNAEHKEDMLRSILSDNFLKSISVQRHENRQLGWVLTEPLIADSTISGFEFGFRVREIYPDGDIAADGNIQVGDLIVGLDDEWFFERTLSDQESDPTNVRSLMNFLKKISENYSEFLRVNYVPESRLMQSISSRSYPLPIVSSPCKKFSVVLQLSNQIDGLGLIITTNNKGRVVITQLKPNSPAHLSGQLQTNDIILQVNGVSLINKTHEESIQILKNSGETVTLVIERQLDRLALDSSITLNGLKTLSPNEMNADFVDGDKTLKVISDSSEASTVVENNYLDELNSLHSKAADLNVGGSANSCNNVLCHSSFSSVDLKDSSSKCTKSTEETPSSSGVDSGNSSRLDQYLPDIRPKGFSPTRLHFIDMCQPNGVGNGSACLKSSETSFLQSNFEVTLVRGDTGLGFNFVIDKSSLKIGAILPGTAAWNAGLSVNQRILEINGVPAEQCRGDLNAGLLTLSKGDIIHLKLFDESSPN